jgi:hypothetical protein
MKIRSRRVATRPLLRVRGDSFKCFHVHPASRQEEEKEEEEEEEEEDDDDRSHRYERVFSLCERCAYQ